MCANVCVCVCDGDRHAALRSSLSILKRIKNTAHFITLNAPVFSGFVIIILLESSPEQISSAKFISRQLYQ